MDYEALAKQYGGTTTKTNSTNIDYSALAKQYGGTTAVSPIQSQNSPIQPTSTATFPAQTGDTVLQTVAKTIGNIPKDTIEFGKGLLHFFNPIENIQKVVDLYNQSASASKELGGLNTTIGTFQALIPGQQKSLNEPNNLGKIGISSNLLTPGMGKQNVGTNIPIENSPYMNLAYKTVVPQFLQQLFSGDLEGARQSLVNRPVQEIGPLVLAAKGVAEKTGYGPQFDSAISKIASPISKPLEIAKNKIAETGGKIATQVLGTATGAGASSIVEAAKGSDAFVEAMRGNVNPDELVNSVEQGVQKIADTRRSQYIQDLQKIGEQKGSLDISSVNRELTKQLKIFNVKVKPDGTLDFSRSAIANSSPARADIQGVYETLKSWGSQPGDTTPVGLDILKKQLGDFYSDSSSARAFVQAVKSNVSNILKEQVPGYSDMTKSYETASNLLNDIKSATGVGGRVRADTIFTKITSAMKNDKEFRLEMLKEVEAKGNQPDLMAKIAGINMQSITPKGLVGKGIDVSAALGFLTHFFNPQMLPIILSTSPRIVGEFVRALGLGTQKTTAILNSINNITESGGLTELKNTFEKQGIKPGLIIEDVSKKISPELQPLAQEARKYKTAEEFVAAQPKLYHGGTADIQAVNTGKSNFSKTFYLSDKADYAKSFGGNKSVVNEMVLDSKANLADMRKPSADLVSQIEAKVNEKIAKNVPYGDKNFSFHPFSKKDVIQGIKDGKAHFAELPEVKTILRELGYDGQITAEVPYAKNIGVWNKSLIKTKSQLTDLWNQANKK